MAAATQNDKPETRTQRRRRWADRIAVMALDEHAGALLIAIAGIGSFVLWALILTAGKATETVHFDSAEAYAWGQQLAWGYGKHPPVSGVIAWLWFSVFPTTDWAMYALAMAVTGVTFALLWLLARRIVEPRRAVLASLLVLVYPILNFKGYKYNADLALMPFVVLVVLIFVIAFERRTFGWAIALGLAGAAAVLDKYWGAWPIIGIGCAALLHPDRRAFFRSPVPYVAAATFAVAMVPHLLWLIRVGFTPFHYAGQYTGATTASAGWHALTASGHFAAMLLPVAVAGAIAIGRPVWHRSKAADPVRTERARHLWVIVVVLAVAPPIVAALLSIRMRSDWGIPMFTMLPLAVIALPRLAIPLRAVPRAATVASLYLMGSLILVPSVAIIKTRTESGARLPIPFDQLAQIATTVWHDRFGGKVPVVAGDIPFAARISFYSPDHPRLFSEADAKLSPWIDTGALAHTGFLGVCRVRESRCIARVAAWRPSAQRIEVTTWRHDAGRNGPEDHWVLLLAAPHPQAPNADSKTQYR